jgi:hypothetical protein
LWRLEDDEDTQHDRERANFHRGNRQMAEFQVLVPSDRKVESVKGDGVAAALMVTITPPEAEFSVQTYSIPNAMPPRVITIQFEIWRRHSLGAAPSSGEADHFHALSGSLQAPKLRIAVFPKENGWHARVYGDEASARPLQKQIDDVTKKLNDLYELETELATIHVNVAHSCDQPKPLDRAQ